MASRGLSRHKGPAYGRAMFGAQHSEDGCGWTAQMVMAVPVCTDVVGHDHSSRVLLALAVGFRSGSRGLRPTCRIVVVHLLGRRHRRSWLCHRMAASVDDAVAVAASRCSGTVSCVLGWLRELRVCDWRR